MTRALPYRPGVGIMLFNAEGKVFVAKRIDMTSEAWQMPQGGIDEGEEPLETAKRELQEETGIDPKYVSVLGEVKEWLVYDLPDELIPKIWGGKYRGQKQKWYAMRLEGDDSLIDIDTKHAEFSEWKWIEPEKLPDIIVPFKKDMYALLAQKLGPLAYKG